MGGLTQPERDAEDRISSVDIRDELRSELSRQGEEKDAVTRARERAAEDEARYDREAQEVKNRLKEAAEIAVQALADSDEEPVTVEVEPKPSGLPGLFGKPVQVDGWRADWRGDGAVICPDGTLFISRSRFERSYRRTSFGEVIEARVSEIGTYRDESIGSLRDRAFGGQGKAGEAESLRSELQRVRDEMVRDISRILSSRGISL